VSKHPVADFVRDRESGAGDCSESRKNLLWERDLRCGRIIETFSKPEFTAFYDLVIEVRKKASHLFENEM